MVAHTTSAGQTAATLAGQAVYNGLAASTDQAVHVAHTTAAGQTGSCTCWPGSTRHPQDHCQTGCCAPPAQQRRPKPESPQRQTSIASIHTVTPRLRTHTQLRDSVS